MLVLIAAIYLLLALRVRILLEGALCSAAGSVVLMAGAAGIYIRFDGILRKTNEGVFLKLVPRYAGSTTWQAAAHHQKVSPACQNREDGAIDHPSARRA